ncbi:MAG: glycoside hydrolase family 3 protein, partial [Solobacterium sp.]|nr:glycoside hydrolase family 3 protein [Solobacterium sp.]
VFGRCQRDWFYVGYGSGGDVHAPYYVNLMDALKNNGARYNKALAAAYHVWTEMPENEAWHGWWGHWPFSHPEMPLDPDLVSLAASSAQTAIVIIGRAAGEDRDNVLEKGSYFLTDAEKAMLDAVTAVFRNTVVVMDTGSIMDMSWTVEYGDRLSAILLAWLGGMESGNAVFDVLYGRVSPCGKLPDTIAGCYEDYPGSADFGGLKFNSYSEGIFVGYRYFDRHPDKVLWPFGFGLSYASFEVEVIEFMRGRVTVKVTNTGGVKGKEVVRLYCHQAKGSIEKAERVLVAFAKMQELEPGDSETCTLFHDDKSISSYDETLHAFILEPGTYSFEANETFAGSFVIAEQVVTEKCEAICSSEVDLRKRILQRLPSAIPPTGDQGIRLDDVKNGKASLDAFTAQLSMPELEALTRGHGMMNSSLGAPGNSGVFGGVIDALRNKGIRPITCCDGPAGLRMRRYCSLMPCGTALAATWNTDLVRELHELIAREMQHYDVDIQLAPGMNIHRNPLCGRNFEYFSEDPVLSGKTAAAVVQGVQAAGKASCPKHFACNNQETKRNTNDSRVSERTLREIYLRNFEICIREAKPLAVMTSYNKINGVWAHYNYDLVTTVLRREWGYEGMVMTDWWMRRSASPEFPTLKDNACRVRAQVDVLMPGDMRHTARNYRSDGSLLKTLGKPDGITLGELQRSAKNVLNLILKLG